MSLLIDTSNLYCAIRTRWGNDGRLIYSRYLESVTDVFGPQDVICYVSQQDSNSIRFVDYLRRRGCTVRMKPPKIIGDVKRTLWGIEIAVDALTLAHPNKPMIIASNDQDLKPLLDKLKPQVGLLAVYAVDVPKLFTNYAAVKEIDESLIQVHHDVTA